MSQANAQKLDLGFIKTRKKASYDELPHKQIGKSDVPKDTMTRLDMKVIKQRKGLGYEQLKNQVVGKMEKDLKGAMKAQGKKFSVVPRHLGREGFHD